MIIKKKLITVEVSKVKYKTKQNIIYFKSQQNFKPSRAIIFVNSFPKFCVISISLVTIKHINKETTLGFLDFCEH